MAAPYLNAEPYGIGELIQLKKRFRVPDHQRDYSWTEEEVGTFIDDILGAIRREVSDYFVGLIVLIGPRAGAWEILDGQQRLATTTMLFSAIRQWLDAAGFEDDARQIDEEFIGVRQLGQEPASRLTMNVNDRGAFSELVLQKTNLRQLREYADAASKHSSQRLLASAATLCRTAVEDWATEGGRKKEQQVAHIYRLAQFLEERVTIVCLELNSEADAYMIFESLNFRGQDLSVLDLVKNHIYSLTPTTAQDTVSKEWALMRSNIADRDADDFLKVFWTSRYGRVQRGDLFRLVKDTFSIPDSVLDLSSSLVEASDPYVAIEEPLHEIWSAFPPPCADHIFALVTLRSKQMRPIILSALQLNFSPQDLQQLLWILVVLTVRHQTVGRRRTGALEIACARLAAEISRKNIRSISEFVRAAKSIMPTDDEFKADFLSYSEPNTRRALYILAALEAHLESKGKGYDTARVRSLVSSPAPVTASRILPREPTQAWNWVMESDPDFYSDAVDRIANWYLSEPKLYRQVVEDNFDYLTKELLAKSSFTLTRDIFEQFRRWDRSSLLERQKRLADLAVETWNFVG